MNSKYPSHNNRSYRLASAKLGAILLIVANLGCSNSSMPQRMPISGSVTLDGNPVDGATIVFEPTDSSECPRTTAAVANGKFELPSQFGPTIGSYSVSVAPLEPDPEETLALGRKGARNTMASYHQLRTALKKHTPIDIYVLPEQENVVVVNLVSK